MRILVVGGGGFIGRHIVESLCQRDHQVTVTARSNRDARSSSPCPESCIAVDYLDACASSFWVDKLQGMDCVINSAGILRETSGNRFDIVHHRGPCALFHGCSEVGVRRVIQISALGADEYADGEYHKSKRAADDCLRKLNLDWVVLQPSVVYGIGSGSGRMFNRIAKLPLAAVPGKGEQMLQPVHVEDLADAIAVLVENRAIRQETIAAVGPKPLSYAELLKTLRRSRGRQPAYFIGVPMPLLRAMATIAALNPKSPLTPETLDMLERGSVADGKRFAEILGHPPRPPEEFETL